jgi:hypothetical protein
MSDDKHTKRPGSMSGEDRALRALAERRARSVAGEIEVPDDDDAFGDEPTPAPIVVDEHNRQLSRSRRPSPFPPDARDRKTIQELAEELWPARKALQMAADAVTRVAAMEARVDAIDSDGPIASLRTELVGHDGKGGIVGHLAQNVARDLEDHRKMVNTVEDRALKADRFVRRVIYGAIGTIAGSIVAAALLIYNAGERAAASRAEANMQRAEVLNKIDHLEDSLTDLRSQVRLLLRSRIDRVDP